MWRVDTVFQSVEDLCMHYDQTVHNSMGEIVQFAYMWHIDTVFQSLEDLCMHYDQTVRNSMGEIVQFAYGGDNLDPTDMEGSDKPVDCKRIMEHIQVNKLVYR